MSDQVFGNLISFYDVERALLDHLKDWFPDYIAARERLNGIVPDSIARPRSHIIRQTFDALPGEEFTPMIVVVSNGTASAPHRFGDDIWSADLGMGISGVCHAASADDARALAGHYQAALLGLFLQKAKFWNGKAVVMSWTGFSVDDISTDQSRTLCSARLNFIVRVSHFADNLYGGPKTISADPLEPVPDLGRVQRTETDVELEGIS
jgi:hypothetical protein